MKKTIGICFFAVVLLVLGIGGFLFLNGSGQTKEQQETQIAEETTEQEGETGQPEAEESMKVQEPFRYIIREKDGFLVVYEQDGETIHLETNIKLETLDEEAKELFREGVPILDERELYDLLESYSS